MSSLRISFVHDWDVNIPQELDWQDGLSRALKELADRGHVVELFVCGPVATIPNPYHLITSTPDMVESVKSFNPDVILCWADFTRPNAKPLKELGVPMALCFSGGETNSYNTYDFDHVFVESQVYKDQLEELGVPCSIAFGTNTELFTPIQQNKVWETIFPATFAAWKRHDLYAQATQGFKALACGYMYDTHEQECWQVCLDKGVTVLPHVSAQVLKYLYAASRVCVVPSMSSGGSQRTVLEAMAMNLPVIVTDSDKFDYEHLIRVEPTADAIREAILSLPEADWNLRDYVVENWSHVTYADALEKELVRLCA